MSALRDEVAADSRPGRQRCTVGLFLEAQPNRKDWDELLPDPEFTSAAICRAMKKRGYRFSEQSIQRHRKGACSCERVA